MIDTQHHFARRMEKIQPNAVGELLRAGADPSIISFAGGYPDATLFPREKLDALFSAAILQQGKTTLQYTLAEGDPALRQHLSQRYARQGMTRNADQFLIVQGSQQGLDLVAKLLINVGDVIVTERPTFLGAPIAFDPCEPSYVSIPVDRHGLDTADLEARLRRGLKPKFVYTIPDFQNPTGATLNAERREHLLQLAARFDFLILEDTAYRPLRYAGVEQPSLLSMDEEGRVIHIGSFSKVLAPGLRLGWLTAAPKLVEKLALLKLAADTQCSTLNMAAVASFMAQHDLDEHVGVLRQAYARKRDLMLAQMRQFFPQEISVTEPDGGLFIWASFPKGFDTTTFMRDKSLPLAKVAFVPGSSFFPETPEHNHARFNFSGPPDGKIEQGIQHLGQVLKTEMARA